MILLKIISGNLNVSAMQLWTGLRFDVYVIKTRVGFEIAEITRF